MEQWTHSLAKFCLVPSACYELFCYFLVLPYPRSRRNSGASIYVVAKLVECGGFTQTMITNYTCMQIAFSIKALEGRPPAVATCRFWRRSSPQNSGARHLDSRHHPLQRASAFGIKKDTNKCKIHL